MNNLSTTFIGRGISMATTSLKIRAKTEISVTNRQNKFNYFLCFRMFHHFPNEEIRLCVISEICRVAEKYVAISYLSPFAATSIRRQIQFKLYGKKYIQHSNSLKKLKNYFAEHGFSLVKDFTQTPFFNTLHLAFFRK